MKSLWPRTMPASVRLPRVTSVWHETLFLLLNPISLLFLLNFAIERRSMQQSAFFKLRFEPLGHCWPNFYSTPSKGATKVIFTCSIVTHATQKTAERADRMTSKCSRSFVWFPISTRNEMPATGIRRQDENTAAVAVVKSLYRPVFHWNFETLIDCMASRPHELSSRGNTQRHLFICCCRIKIG